MLPMKRRHRGAIVVLTIGFAAMLGCGTATTSTPLATNADTEHAMKPTKPAVQTLLTGLGFGESPRWHQGRLWFANWGKQEVVTVDRDGKSNVMFKVQTTIPFSMDWLPDGRLLVVSGPERLLLRQEPDGSFVTHADLRQVAEQNGNEIVVDGRGNVYVNGGGVDQPGKMPSGVIALVTPDGTVRQVADGIAFPNGMAVSPDNSTLIISESFAKKLTAFDIATDGSLLNRRVWADLGDGVPDGICIDAEKAVWYADTPNKRCVRVREGGQVLQTVQVDRGCFACMLGGADRRTLFITAAEWRGFEKMMEGIGTGQVLTVEAPAAGAGWP
jgi:sugar lactone lactonase YvrE